MKGTEKRKEAPPEKGHPAKKLCKLQDEGAVAKKNDRHITIKENRLDIKSGDEEEIMHTKSPIVFNYDNARGIFVLKNEGQLPLMAPPSMKDAFLLAANVYSHETNASYEECNNQDDNKPVIDEQDNSIADVALWVFRGLRSTMDRWLLERARSRFTSDGKCNIAFHDVPPLSGFNKAVKDRVLTVEVTENDERDSQGEGATGILCTRLFFRFDRDKNDFVFDREGFERVVTSELESKVMLNLARQFADRSE